MKLLIVEDDDAAARLLHQAVAEAGYSSEVTASGTTALHLACTNTYDLVYLDLMLPGMDGISICRRMRAAGVQTPVLMLTARDTTEDKVAGLDSGADDYLVKPFRIAELLARTRALLRRQVVITQPALLRVADLTLDTTTRDVVRNGRPVALSATEYKLVEHLMRHQGQVLTRSALLDHIWQYDFGGNNNVLDVYISYLRSKVDKGHAVPLIHTVRGVGYRIGSASAEPVGG